MCLSECKISQQVEQTFLKVYIWELLLEFVTWLTESQSNSTEQNHASETDSSSARQEILRILWNAKFPYLIPYSPPSVANVSQMNTLHDMPACFFKIKIKLSSNFQAVSFLQVSPSKLCKGFSSLQYILLSPSSSSFSIWSPQKHFVRVDYKSWSSSFCNSFHFPVTAPY